MKTSQWRRAVENRCVFSARLKAISDRSGVRSASGRRFHGLVRWLRNVVVQLQYERVEPYSASRQLSTPTGGLQNHFLVCWHSHTHRHVEKYQLLLSRLISSVPYVLWIVSCCLKHVMLCCSSIGRHHRHRSGQCRCSHSRYWPLSRQKVKFVLNLYSTKVIIMPHRIICSWYTRRWRVHCYICCSEDGTGKGRSPPSPLLAVPNVTVHPSTASVPITVLLYNGTLLCGFNVPIK